MKTNLEIEYKTLINEEQFNKLIEAYQVKPVLQKNTYYDSSVMDLKAHGYAIRIRDINNIHLFTMKEKSEKGNMEYEVELNENSLDALYSESLKDLFNSKHIEGPFISVGELYTFRVEVKMEYGLLCIDENHHNDTVDYEIEYEIDINNPEKAKTEFYNLLSKFNITYKEALPKRVRATK